MAAAAASPASIPRVFAFPSAMASSEASYWPSSVCNWAGYSAASTRKAAVAAAASFDAQCLARGTRRYGW